MAEIAGVAESFAQPFVDAVAEVAPVLDERARRLLLGAAARQIGRGGITLVAAASGASVDTVGRGAAELEAGVVADGRVRARGAGRRSVEENDPGLWPALEALVDPETRGDPMSELRWTTTSTVNLAEELTAHGHPVAPKTVARVLKDHDYSLQANTKTVEGKQHPDRDAQFRYINSQVAEFLDARLPVISVDTKKKELVGNFKNGGREYEPAGEPQEVDTYDFMGAVGKGGALRGVRRRRQLRMGERGYRRRHRAVRRGVDPPLVEPGGAGGVPGGDQAADHRRRWWLQRFPAAVVEDRTRRVRRRDRPADHRAAFPARNLEVESGRTPGCSPRSP